MRGASDAMKDSPDDVETYRPTAWLTVLEPRTPTAAYNLLRRSHSFWKQSTKYPIFRGHADSRWPLMPVAWRPDALPRSSFPGYLSAGPIGFYTWEGRDHETEAKLPYRSLDFERIAAAAIQFGSEVRTLNEFWEMCNSVGLSVPALKLVVEGDEHNPPRPDQLKFIWETQRSLKTWQPTEIFGLAQHHGVPTRLLDFTSNPKKALLFACDALLQASINSDEMAVWAIDDPWSYNIALEHYRPSGFPLAQIDLTTFPRAQNSYLHHQDGVFIFLRHADHWAMLRGSYPSIEDIFDLFFGVDGIERDRLGGPDGFVTSIRIFGGSDGVEALVPYGADIDLPLAYKVLMPSSFAYELYDLLIEDELTPLHLMPSYDGASRQMKIRRTLEKKRSGK